MIGTVFKVSLLRLWNTKQELVLILIVPILFFSIFAMIFSRGVGQTAKQVRVSIINDDDSQVTRKIISGALKRSELKRVTGVGKTTPDWPIERLARAILGMGNAEVVIYFPSGYAKALSDCRFARGEGTLRAQQPIIRILNEGTNPISSQIAEAAIAQAVALHGGRPELASTVQLASAVTGSDKLGMGFNAGAEFQQPFETQNVFATNKHQPKIAMYAAGIAVMFVLFSSSGAGASLLEEKEAGTLERLLISRLTITQLLIGKWIYIFVLGFLQTTVMFAWGQLVFEVDLVGHLTGFLVVTAATTAASASFALFLATACRSRNQLNGVSLIVVLSMSALGGSMIPRYIMSESMQRLGRYTFNGWALDGYKKIFWYDLPLSAVRLEIVVLLMIAVILGLAANLLVRRWSVA